MNQHILQIWQEKWLKVLIDAGLSQASSMQAFYNRYGKGSRINTDSDAEQEARSWLLANGFMPAR